MSSVEDPFAIMELLTEYATIPDERNFEGVFRVFSDSVRWDFESLGAGPASMMTPAEIKTWLLPGFTGFVATHHATTNHRIVVDGDHAPIRAHITPSIGSTQPRLATGPPAGLRPASMMTRPSVPRTLGVSPVSGSR